MTSLLILMLACTDTSDTGVETGGDTADSGGDTAVESTDCTVQSLEPRTSSWNGGETITLTLDCDDPSLVGSLNINIGDNSYPATLGAIDGRSLTATFVPGTQTAAGQFNWDLDGDGVAQIQDEAQINFRVDPGELDTRVETHATERMGWGAPVSAATIDSSGNTLVLSTFSDQILVGAKSAEGDWHSAKLSLSPMEVDVDNGVAIGSYGANAQSWTFSDAANGLQAIVTPVLESGTSSKQLELVVAVHNGSSLSTQVITLPYSSTGQYTPKAGSESTQAPLVMGVELEMDSAGAVTGMTVALQVSTAQDKASGALESLSYSAKDGGGGMWVRNWQYSLSSVHHVSGTVNTSSGQQGLVVFQDNSDGQPTARLLDSSTGKSLANTTFKTVSGLVQVVSAPVTEAKGTGVAIAMLDESGGITMGQISFSGLDTMDTTLSTLSSDSADVLGLDLRGGSDGGVHLATKRGSGKGVCRYGQCFPSTSSVQAHRGGDWLSLDGISFSLTTWSGDVGTVNLGDTPDSFEVLSLKGYTALVGSTWQTVEGEPQAIGHNGGPNLLNSGDITVCTPAGWELQISGGALLATNPEGVQLSDSLPLDPTAELSCDVVDGRLVVNGTLLTTSEDGSTTQEPGLVTTGASGMGTASFGKGDKIFVRVTPWDGESRYQTSGGSPADTTLSMHATYSRAGDDGGTVYGVSVGTLAASELPAAGEQLTLDLSWSDWGSESSTQADTQGAYLFSPSDLLGGARIQGGTHSSELLADNAEVSVLSALSGGQKLPDMVAVLPYSGTQCGQATYFVPGTSSDVAANLASAILLYTSDRTDCADLPQPMAMMDPDGEGVGTVIMAAPVDGDALDGDWDLWEMLWDGADLLALPAQTVPAFESLAIVDLDGDTFDEVMLGIVGPAGDDGVQSDPLSGLLLRGGGVFGISSVQIGLRQIRMASMSGGAPADSGTGITGAALDGQSGVVVLSGTAGQTAKGSCVSCEQPSAVRIFSWGAVLD